MESIARRGRGTEVVPCFRRGIEKQILRLPPPGLRKRLGPRALRMTAAFGVPCIPDDSCVLCPCARMNEV